MRPLVIATITSQLSRFAEMDPERWANSWTDWLARIFSDPQQAADDLMLVSHSYAGQVTDSLDNGRRGAIMFVGCVQLATLVQLLATERTTNENISRKIKA